MLNICGFSYDFRHIPVHALSFAAYIYYYYILSMFTISCYLFNIILFKAPQNNVILCNYFILMLFSLDTNISLNGTYHFCPKITL